MSIKTHVLQHKCLGHNSKERTERLVNNEILEHLAFDDTRFPLIALMINEKIKKEKYKLYQKTSKSFIQIVVLFLYLLIHYYFIAL